MGSYEMQLLDFEGFVWLISQHCGLSYGLSSDWGHRL